MISIWSKGFERRNSFITPSVHSAAEETSKGDFTNCDNFISAKFWNLAVDLFLRSGIKFENTALSILEFDL